MADKVDKAFENMIANLEEKTGKKLAAWIAVVHAMGELKHGQIVAALKADHGLTHGYANMVAHSSKGAVVKDDNAKEDLVAAQYTGAKEPMKALYDKILKIVGKFGEVEISPKKAYVSLRRAKQFAIVQPTTATRLDVGLNLKGVEPGERLEVSGSFNSMVTHRVRVGSAKEIDAELTAWLKQAYEMAGAAK